MSKLTLKEINLKINQLVDALLIDSKRIDLRLKLYFYINLKEKRNSAQ